MTQLRNIADDMRRRDETLGGASALLQRGLRIRYEVSGCNRRIAIARLDAPPSIKEREIVADAFGLEIKEWHCQHIMVKALNQKMFIADFQWVAEEPQS